MVNYACAFSQSESGKYFECGDWQQMSCINSPGPPVYSYLKLEPAIRGRYVTIAEVIGW